MMNRLFLLIFPLLGLLLLAQPPAQPTTAAQEAPAPAPAETSDVIEMTGALGLPSPSAYGRAAVHVDALVAKLVDGSFTQPKVGESVRRHDGTEVKWRAVSADDKGNIADDELRGGYLYWSVPADSDEIRILNAAGHSMVYVNGEPRQGDPYGHGFVELPVKLKKGVNHFLFSYGRGPVRAKLEKPRAGAFISKHDMTLPDIVKDELNKNYLGAVVIVNASEEPLKGAVLSVQEKDGQGTDVGLPFISPLSVRKVGFSVTSSGVPSDETPDHDYVFTLRTGQRQLVETDRVETKLAIKSHRDARKVTFISGIDGSVQFYGLRQAQPLRGTEDKPGIVLSLHGAGVDARGQANAYSSKSWCHVVCPTNRRGFGFDWEDWGRLDALEVLQHAQATLPNDPSKVYLTGHSMGGHGTWTVGAHFPDRFAAIGPSAGWIDFWSYSGSGGRYKEGAPAAELLSRVLNPSRTLLMKENYAQQGIYILHGEEDDNVPASEAREMVKQLEPFHRDYVYFEQPGAGHWWDGDDELGAACVDWAPMFDFFARHRLRKESEVRHVSFTTINPGHSAKCHWVSIEQQIKQLAPSKVDIRVDPTLRRFRGTTENVARFAILLKDVLSPGEPVRIELDGEIIESVEWPERAHVVWLVRGPEGWQPAETVTLKDKGPHRNGLFKSAISNRVVFVYGTAGSEEEKGWAYAKARYDAEQFWYRGNGSIELVSDRDFVMARYRDRNVVLYGNADSNLRWDALLGESPIQVKGGEISIGDKRIAGDDLSLLMVRPRPDSVGAVVAAVSGTGIRGMKLNDRHMYFVSGAGYPDYLAVSSDMLAKGTEGVVAAGMFANDWSLGDDRVLKGRE